MTNRIRQSLELQAILEAAVEELQAFLCTDRVKIYQFYPDGHGAVIAEAIYEQRLPSLLGLHFPADDIPPEARNLFITARQRVIVDMAAQQRWTNALNDAVTGAQLPQADIRYRTVEPCHSEYLQAMGVQSSLVIPILHQTQLWGLLVSHHAEPHDFTSEELDIAQLVVDQLEIAIAQSILLTQAQHKAQRECDLNQITTSLHSLTTVDFQAALEATVVSLNCDSGRLFQQGQSKDFSKLYTVGQQPTSPTSLQSTRLEEHILWREYFYTRASEYSHPNVYALPDLYQEPRLRVLAACFFDTPLRGLLVIPLQYRQQVMGYLSLFRNEINVKTTWAGQFDPDVRQAQPRNSFLAWIEEKRGQSTPWLPEEIELAQSLAHHFAIALYQQQLYQQLQSENRQRREVETALRRQAEEDRLLAAILQRIRQSLSLETVLDTTVAEVRQFLHTDRVLLYQFNSKWSGVVVAESVSQHRLSILGQTIDDPCFPNQQLYKAYSQGRISQISNVYQEDLKPCYAQLLTDLSVQANLVVPILLGDTPEPTQATADRPRSQLETPQSTHLWGLLIAHHCVSPRQWQTWEIRFLQQLSVQVAIALQQAELYQQLQRLNVTLEAQVQDRTAELQRSLNYADLIQQITVKIRDSLDEHQILQTAVEALANGLQVGCCDAALYDLEQHTSTICHEHIRIPIAAARGLTIAMEQQPELYAQLLAGQAFQFCRNRQTNRPNVVMRPLNQRYAIACCALQDDQSVLGDLWLFKPAHDYFDEMELRVIHQVANQCAIAIRQARLYQTAQTQVEELARLNHLKDDFLSTVSHELRTPMSSIKLATQMLEVILKETGILDVDSNKATQYFQILNAECKREIGLINDLLDLTRLDAGTEPLAATAIALQVWIPHIAESFHERTASQGQQFEIDIPADFPAFSTDLAYLERMLTELLNNACKYTPPGGTIRLTTTLVAHPPPVAATPPLAANLLERLDQEDTAHFNDVIATLEAEHAPLPAVCGVPPWIHIQITNTGVEIPLTERDRIFERFYRIPNSDPWKHGGTGLGLALVKRMATYLGGSIHVDSNHHETCFTVTLPNLSGCPRAIAPPAPTRD